MTSMSNAIQSAFPWVSQGGVHEHQVVEGGLTKRELLAAMAMQGICSSMAYDEQSFQETAALAVRQADALLAELAK